MTPSHGRDEPDAQNAMDDLDGRILRIAEAIGRHLAREDMAKRSKNRITKPEADFDNRDR